MKKIWLDQYLPGTPENIDPDAYCSLDALLSSYIQRYADRPAFTNFGVTLTFQEVDHYATQLAAYFQQVLKLVPGDHVAVMLPNLLQYPVAVFAILKAGLTVVNINPLYTVYELGFPLKNSNAKAIIVLANFMATLTKVLPDTDIQHVIVTEVGDFLGGLKGAVYNFSLRYLQRKVPDWKYSGAKMLHEVLAMGKRATFQAVVIDNKSLAFLQYTGGTTGQSKAAMLTHRNMVANVLQAVAMVKGVVNEGGEVLVGALPFYHIFALTVCCLCFVALGAQCLLITNPRDLRAFIKTLHRKPPTIFVGINTLFRGLLKHPHFSQIDFSKLKLTIGGGMATNKKVAQDWKRSTGVPILEGYGMTETSPIVALTPLTKKKFMGSAGVPVPSTEIDIRDQKGHSLPVGQEGELFVKGPQVMHGYWGQLEETAHILSQDGWLATGDMARVDEHGYIYIVDRKKDMILVSGFNVYPNEVEAVLVQHPKVKEAAVVGVKDSKTGEAICAFVVYDLEGVDKIEINKPENIDNSLKSKETESQETKLRKSLFAYCREHLTSYKIPKYIQFCDELPKTHVGKVSRHQLRGHKSCTDINHQQ